MYLVVDGTPVVGVPVADLIGPLLDDEQLAAIWRYAAVGDHLDAVLDAVEPVTERLVDRGNARHGSVTAASAMAA